MAILPDYQLKLKDISLAAEYVVKDFHACSFLKESDIVWVRILRFDGQCFCVGMGPYVIPARYHLALLEYRWDFQKELYGESITINNLRKYKEANRLYFDILGKQLAIDSQCSVSPTEEAFEVCSLYFLLQKEIEEVFKKMSPLKLSEDIFLDKKRDKQGRLRCVKFNLPIKNPKQSEEMRKSMQV